MDDLPFGYEEFDVIWSEGAAILKKFCTSGGCIVISDLTLFDTPAPEELVKFMQPDGVILYPEEERSRQI
jgi:hypothetical protein